MLSIMRRASVERADADADYTTLYGISNAPLQRPAGDESEEDFAPDYVPVLSVQRPTPGERPDAATVKVSGALERFPVLKLDDGEDVRPSQLTLTTVPERPYNADEQPQYALDVELVPFTGRGITRYAAPEFPGEAPGAIVEPDPIDANKGEPLHTRATDGASWLPRALLAAALTFALA